MSLSVCTAAMTGDRVLCVPLPESFPAHPSPESLSLLHFVLGAVAQVCPPGEVQVEAFVARFADVEAFAVELLPPRAVHAFAAGDRRSVTCVRCLTELAAADYRRRLAISKRISERARERYEREQRVLFGSLTDDQVREIREYFAARRAAEASAWESDRASS